MGNSCRKHSGATVSCTEETIVSPLSNKKLELVETSWSNVEQHWKEICELAFERSFVTYPELREFFHTENTELALPEVLNSTIIQDHIESFKVLIDNAVYQTEKNSVLMQKMLEYGKFHLKFGVKKEYIIELAANLKIGVCHYVEDLSAHKYTHNAWGQMFDFLSGYLVLGMDRAAAKNDISTVTSDGFCQPLQDEKSFDDIDNKAQR